MPTPKLDLDGTHNLQYLILCTLNNIYKFQWRELHYTQTNLKNQNSTLNKKCYHSLFIFQLIIIPGMKQLGK